MLKKACSEEQINIRKKEIIKATSDMFDTIDYQEISMKTISERISIARSSLYCYYHSKEEIMLDVLKNDYIIFIKQLINAFRNNKNLIDDITSVYLKNERLLKIISIYLTDIEIHSSLDKLIEFKMPFVSLFKELRESLKSTFNNQSEEKITSINNALIMLAHSLYPMIHPSENQKIAMKTVGMMVQEDEYQICSNHICLIFDNLIKCIY